MLGGDRETHTPTRALLLAALLVCALGAALAPAPAMLADRAAANEPAPTGSPMAPTVSALSLALVIRQPSPTPTYAPVVPEVGEWRGVDIRFTVSSDARYLPDGSAYTACGWAVWQRLEPISVDGRFDITMPEGSVRGRFTSPRVCQGVTTGWRNIDGQWCRDERSWVAYPLASTPTLTPAGN